MKKYRTICQGLRPEYKLGNAFCGWSGYRRARSEVAAEKKPCPACGGPVTAIRARR